MSEPNRNRSPSPASASTSGLLANLRFDAQSGFLVALVALPMGLATARASHYEPLAGVWTGVIGGLLVCLLSNAPLAVKGPAAGLVVVAQGAVLALGSDLVGRNAPLDVKLAAGYPLALGVGITASMIQILFGLLKLGKLGELIPLGPIHAMLVAVGMTVAARQLFVVLGQDVPSGPAIEAIAALPGALLKPNSAVAAVGGVSLAILLVFPLLKGRVSLLKAVPGQVMVLLVAVPLALALGLPDAVDARGAKAFLVNVPNVVDHPAKAICFPDFRGVATLTGLEYVILFALIGSLESILGTQAADTLDPRQRKTDQNGDLVAIGVANTLCAAVGALPMVSEVVRSKVNIDAGARTKYANFFHGLWLLAFVLLLPSVIRMIPLAALAAMLVYAGLRLASPREFVQTYRLGAEQLVVFVATIAVTLCTGMLLGVAAGIALKILIHLLNGAPVRSLLGPDIEVAHSELEQVAVLRVRHAAIFANWPGLKNAITAQAEGRLEVVLDLSATMLVDHSTMEKLHQLEAEFTEAGKRLTVTGLEHHTPMSSHPLAARKGTRAVASEMDTSAAA